MIADACGFRDGDVLRVPRQQQLLDHVDVVEQIAAFFDRLTGVEADAHPQSLRIGS